jgi:ribosome-binding protein aMBF1 (putative translation factor)
MEHQNWETYIVHCKDTKKDKKDTDSKKQISKTQKIENMEKEDNLKHKKIDKELSKKIQQMRLSKGWTQKQLAQKINVNPIIINEIESGKALYNGQHIGKLKRLLNIKNNKK